MSKILIALYMGLLPSFGRPSQEPNYSMNGQRHGSQANSRLPEDDGLLSGTDFAQPSDRSFADKKIQEGIIPPTLNLSTLPAQDSHIGSKVLVRNH